MLIGPAVFLILAAVVVMFDPLLVMGDPEWRRAPARAVHRPGVPAPRHVPTHYGEPAGRSARPARRTSGRATCRAAAVHGVHRSQDW